MSAATSSNGRRVRVDGDNRILVSRTPAPITTYVRATTAASTKTRMPDGSPTAVMLVVPDETLAASRAAPPAALPPDPSWRR